MAAKTARGTWNRACDANTAKSTKEVVPITAHPVLAPDAKLMADLENEVLVAKLPQSAEVILAKP